MQLTQGLHRTLGGILHCDDLEYNSPHNTDKSIYKKQQSSH